MRVFAYFDIELLGFDQYLTRGLGYFPPGMNINIVTRNQQDPDRGQLLGRISYITKTQRYNTN